MRVEKRREKRMFKFDCSNVYSGGCKDVSEGLEMKDGPRISLIYSSERN